MENNKTIVPKVVVCATSGLMGQFITSLLIETEQAKKEDVYGFTRSTWAGYAPALRTVYTQWREQGVKDGDVRVIVAFDSLDPDQDFGELMFMLDNRAGIEAIVFCPGFDYIFNEDKELMKQYIHDPEHRVPTENCKRGQIRFINNKSEQ